MSGKRSGGILSGPMVFVDLETNGLNHIRGRVIEVAAIRVEGGRIVRSFTSLVDPETELPQFITNLTGIAATDLKGAPTFAQVADELNEVLDGAVFVAHNVRFDYSFLKQEFKRLNKPFLPKQLCTVKLSRALFPEYRSHKLQNLIERYGFTYAARHRAYDDAAVLWQFIQYIQKNVAVEVVEAAIAKQLRQPAIPKYVDQALVKDLPTAAGVYIFEDEKGRPLYVGKSVNIKKRVLQHFGHDHDDSKEFKIAQSIHHIRTQETSGELSALLLESRLVKELQPLHNRQLRRMSRLSIAKYLETDEGYGMVILEDATPEAAASRHDTLATYPRKSQAKKALEEALRQYELCPRLLGLENGKGACFWYQLGKCRGACIGKEPKEDYNNRLLSAFARRRIQAWPYRGAVLVQENETTGIVVEDWCVIAEIEQQEDCDPHVVARGKVFDLDTYKILQSFMSAKNGLRINQLSLAQLTQLGLG